jgi:hypothetical protein
MRIIKFMLFMLLMVVAYHARAEPTRVKFPEKVKEMVHYTTVRRSNVVEHIVANREAIEAVKKKQPIPNGSTFVLIDYRDGKLYRYFVMEKGAGWGNDYDSRKRTGDWQYQWYWPDKTINKSEDTARCMSCHQSQENSDFLYTGYRIPHFNGQPVE